MSVVVDEPVPESSCRAILGFHDVRRARHVQPQHDARHGLDDPVDLGAVDCPGERLLERPEPLVAEVASTGRDGTLRQRVGLEHLGREMGHAHDLASVAGEHRQCEERLALEVVGRMGGDLVAAVADAALAQVDDEDGCRRVRRLLVTMRREGLGGPEVHLWRGDRVPRWVLRWRTIPGTPGRARAASVRTTRPRAVPRGRQSAE